MLLSHLKPKAKAEAKTAAKAAATLRQDGDIVSHVLAGPKICTRIYSDNARVRIKKQLE